jgi:autotransporter-associated beta strand protein
MSVLSNPIIDVTGLFFSPDMRIDAVLFGAGGFAKNGVGEVGLTAANTYSGTTTVNDGILQVDDSSALGTTAGGTIVNSGAVLALRFGVHVPSEPLTLAGTGQSSFGALSSLFGSNSWTGNVTLSANATVYVAAGDFLNLTGAIGGAFNLAKTGTGTLNFSGGSNNTFNNLSVSAGTLLLDKTVVNAAFAGDLTIGDGSGTDTVRLLRDDQIPDSAAVTMAGAAVFHLNDQDETTGTVGGSGTIDIGTGIFRVGSDNGNSAFDGLIIGTGQIFKLGPGNWTLTGNNTYSGHTTVSAGTLTVNGSQANSDMTVNGSANLGGDGVVGDLDVFGNLRPGSSPAILTTSNFVFHPSASDFFVELNGLSPGSGYDQLKVRGTVGLSNATLHATLGFQSAISNSFTIIDNDGADAVIGTFAGLAQGGTVFVSGVPFRISYTGGTGNDVVLTQLLGVPILKILQSGSANVVLSWPSNFTGFTLEANTNLNSGIWASVAPLPVVSGTNQVVTNAASGTQKSYRLRNP